MKKRLFAFGLALVLAISLAACGNNGGDQSSEKGKQVLEEMEAANAPKALLEKYGSFSMTSQDPDRGATVTYYETTDGGYNMFMRDPSGAELASTPKGNFIWISEEEKLATPYESPEEYESRKEEIISAPIYAYNPKDEVKEYKEEDGKITVLAVLHMESPVDGYDAFRSLWGIDDETFDYYNQYVVDAQTKELIENISYCELSTGRKDLSHATFTYGDTYEMGDGLKQLIESAE